MQLKAGTRLGPYEIVAPLGAGGMGEVYRALDTRLGREIAIKVLPELWANDAARLRRFEQEARALAALNHPNLLALYDTGTFDGSTYLVTELLQGETLAARMAEGAMSQPQAVETGRAIAAGLAAAHDRNLVHRDLKPANVFLTRDGQIKLLDFGLARLAAPVNNSGDGGEVPTLGPGTAPGEILGTAGYMAPEQVRGQPTDARTDLFAFGAMLFEMLTGRRAFQRDTDAETMTAVLRDEPPLPRPTDPAIPPALDRIVRRCLEKPPSRRFHSAHDLGFALENTAGTATAIAPASTLAAPGLWWWLRRMGVFAAGVALTLTVLWWRGSIGEGSSREDALGASTVSYRPFSFEAGGQGNPVWSPDGRAVAYSASANAGDAPQVYVRDLDSPVPQKLTEIAEGASPGAWTPDGRHVLFYSKHAPAGIWTVSIAGGAAQPLLAYSALFNGWAVAPDYSSLTVLQQDAESNISIAVSSPPGAPLRSYLPMGKGLFQHDSSLAYSPDGKQLLLFVGRARTALLMPFPPDPTHPPKPILSALVARGYADTPVFSWLPDSRHIVLAINAPHSYTAASQLWVADVESGEAHQIENATSPQAYPALSPDGKRLIFAEPSGDSDVVSIDVANASARKLIATERTEDMPSWAAHQQAIAYDTDRNGEIEIWMHEPGRTDRPLVTPQDFPAGTTAVLVLPTLSPKADRVAYLRLEAAADQPGSGNQRLWISSIAGGAPVPLTNTPAQWDPHTGNLFVGEIVGDWSPDGNEMVFLRVMGSSLQMMKVETSGQAVPTLLREGVAAVAPVWSPTGEWIAYCEADGDYLISPDGKKRRRLGRWTTPAWAFSADGRRLYGMRPAPAGAGGQNGDLQLFYIEVASGAETAVGLVPIGYAPNAYCPPCYRFSLAPDGRSLAYAAGNVTQNLWLMDGFRSPATGWSRLRALFH